MLSAPSLRVVQLQPRAATTCWCRFALPTVQDAFARNRQTSDCISWLALRGKCAHCSTRISARNPIVEALTALLSANRRLEVRTDMADGAAFVFTWTLIALTFIDADTTLFPMIDVALLWLGLLANVYGYVQYPSQNAVLGAASRLSGAVGHLLAV